MTYQQIASIVRQIAAIAAVVMGALTQALAGIHLPTGVSATLVAIGGVVMAIEHYVSDPSTGSPTPATPVKTTAAPVTAPPVPAVPVVPTQIG